MHVHAHVHTRTHNILSFPVMANFNAWTNTVCDLHNKPINLASQINRPKIFRGSGGQAVETKMAILNFKNNHLCLYCIVFQMF